MSIGARIRPVLLAILLAAPSFVAAPALAQQGYEPPLADEAPGPDDNGLSLIERGIGILMQNFWDDVGPDLNRLGEDMSQALSRMSPVLEDLSALVDDLGNYQPPQRLENGDIVIRRKPGAPPPPPIGDGLRDFSAPREAPAPLPLDPYAPEIEL